MSNFGTVYLVGAGPGDPGLVTLRAVELLGRADLVLYDYLVNPQILHHARPGAQLVCLGRHGRDRILSQDEVNERLIAAARAGRTVVRLKSGDPLIFGRCAEETDALRQAGIGYEIVPGISVALAAGSYAGIPLTHRGLASAVAFITGHEQNEKSAPALDYAALARFPGTLVFYMGVTNVEAWSAALVAAGKSPDTPAAIVRRCTWPDQLTIHSTLGAVAREISTRRLRPPVIVIVGAVVGLAPAIDWFTTRPLFGRRVLVTRAADQAGSFVHRLEELGAQVYVQPAIAIGPPDDWQPVDGAIARLDRYDWLVFSSANGVRYFFDRLLALGKDLRHLGRAKLAVIGPGSAAELARFHLKADVQPQEYRAEALAAALAGNAAGRRFLLLRASRGREVLAEELKAAGASVEQVVVYTSRDVATADPDAAAALAGGRIDYVTVTSSAIARSLVQLFGEDLGRAQLVSISPLTSATLGELGHAPALEAKSYTMAGIVAAMLNA